MNYSTCRIILYPKWIIGSAQLEDTDQHLSLKRFIRLSSTTTSHMLWLTCLMKLSYQGQWVPWTWSFRELYITTMRGTRVTMIMGFCPTSQDQSMSTPCSQQRPPSTQLTTAQPRARFSPFTPRCPRDLPFWVGVYQWLTFNETPLLVLAEDSEDREEDLPTAG